MLFLDYGNDRSTEAVYRGNMSKCGKTVKIPLTRVD